jgi:hypothetical protein
MSNWQAWVKGLLAAVIGGMASAVSLVIVDPNDFNLDTGLVKLGKVCVVAAIINASMYLKASPLPTNVSQG